MAEEINPADRPLIQWIKTLLNERPLHIVALLALILSSISMFVLWSERAQNPILQQQITALQESTALQLQIDSLKEEMDRRLKVVDTRLLLRQNDISRIDEKIIVHDLVLTPFLIDKLQGTDNGKQ